MQTDLVIIGAGPAGMAAAALAGKNGLKVVILDEQPQPGGQIYRDVDRVAAIRGHILGRDYTRGRRLTAQLDHQNITVIFGATVWLIDPCGKIQYTAAGQSAEISAHHVLVATGALERPMPLPGWTLPGVMTAGAGQILLKQSGVLAPNAVLVGSGPLLYLVAAQMARAGCAPVAMVETQTRTDFWQSLRHIAGAIRGWRHLVKGASLLRAIRKAGVARYRSATQISIVGETSVRAVQFVAQGRNIEFVCDTVFLHHGVIPNIQAAKSIGVAHHWDHRQQCFRPTCDDWGQTNHAQIFIAGDGAGIGGAVAAKLQGQIAALKIAQLQGAIHETSFGDTMRPIRRDLNAEMAIRPFLDVAFPPSKQAIQPRDDTIICRCEEITAGTIRQLSGPGCRGPNQTKAFCRAGMGPCQGRYCGVTVTMLLAAQNNLTPDQTGYFNIRAPIKPVTLGDIVQMGDVD